MSHYDSHIIGIFQDDSETVKEFLKIAINTIFFNRLLNNNKYICESSAIKNISYMKIEDDSLQKDIGNKLNEISSLSKHYQKFQINLDFYTPYQGGIFGFFKKKGNIWEQWSILVIITEKGSKDKESNMRKIISNILNEVNTNKDFMPDIKLKSFENLSNMDNKEENNDNCNIPYEITIKTEFEQNSMIKLFRENKFNNQE